MASNPTSVENLNSGGENDSIRTAPLTPAAQQRNGHLEMSSILVDHGYLHISRKSSEEPSTPATPELKYNESLRGNGVAVTCASCGPPCVEDAHSRVGSVALLLDAPSLADNDGSFIPAPDVVSVSPNKAKERPHTCNGRIHQFLDLFVVEPRAANSVGSATTIIVVCAAIVYAVILLLQTMSAPLYSVNEVKWSAGKFFPCQLQCLSPSGCVVSNTLNPNDPQPCVTVSHLDYFDLKMGRSEDAAMGISVAGLRSGSEPLVSINSDMYMEPDPSLPADDPMNTGIVDFVVDMPSKLSMGTHLAWYVETHNKTRTGKGALRREFFVQQVNSDGGVLASSTSCGVPEGWVQTRIRLMPQWNEITVDYETSLLDWFGTSAGMYAAFVSWGAMLVGTWEFWSGMV
uniref:Uncharacterized protein n=1 Tax=Hemiselmis andersenii TaxID=464988 RepID=A0A6U2CKQ6_HEMAN